MKTSPSINGPKDCEGYQLESNTGISFRPTYGMVKERYDLTRKAAIQEKKADDAMKRVDDEKKQLEAMKAEMRHMKEKIEKSDADLKKTKADYARYQSSNRALRARLQPEGRHLLIGDKLEELAKELSPTSREEFKNRALPSLQAAMISGEDFHLPKPTGKSFF